MGINFRGQAPHSGSPSKARFIRRISHVPNLIQQLNTCEVERLNQINSTDLN